MSPSLSKTSHPPGVYCTLGDLVTLRGQARGFSFLPRQPIHSILAGRHASRLRGRGLNFEEIRRYLPGDDVRQIDWKVTARTRRTHTRVYTEERDFERREGTYALLNLLAERDCRTYIDPNRPNVIGDMLRDG